MSELGQVLTGNLSGDPQKIITLFVKSVFTFDSLASNGILIINLIMLIAFVVIGIRLKYKKFVLLTWGFVDISIVTYYIGILLMYLTAMPTDEALCFEHRYLCFWLFDHGFSMGNGQGPV